MERPKIGELLVAADVIDEATLQAALEKQRTQGGRIGKILLGMGALDEETLVRSVARQLDMPVAWLRGKQVRADVLLMLPKHVALRHRCLPVMLDRKGTETLLVAMEDPSDTDALDEIAIAAGRPVRVVLSAPSELDDALARHYPESEDAESEEEESEHAESTDEESEDAESEDEESEDEEPELLLTEPVVTSGAADPEPRRRTEEREEPEEPDEPQALETPPAAADPLDLGGDYDPSVVPHDTPDLAPDGDDLGLDAGPALPASGPGDSLDDAIGAVRGLDAEEAPEGRERHEEGESLFGDDPLEATLPPPPRRPASSEVLPRDPELRAVALLLIERGLLRSEELSERLLALRRDGDDDAS
jgi:hypothetical protein